MKPDLSVVINEINAGLPPGSLPDPNAPAVPDQADWAKKLQEMQTPQMAAPQGVGQWSDADVLAAVKDKAVAAQDQTMAAMFGDVLPVKRQDTSGLPAAVDRYLDKVLSA
jgi:hypothetical protein